MDPESFPPGNELYQKGCAFFMAKFYKRILKALRKRLDPEADEFEEDIVPSLFCQEVRACKDGMRSMDQSFADAQARRAWEKQSKKDL